MADDTLVSFVIWDRKLGNDSGPYAILLLRFASPGTCPPASRNTFTAAALAACANFSAVDLMLPVAPFSEPRLYEEPCMPRPQKYVQQLHAGRFFLRFSAIVCCTFGDQADF